MNVPLCQLGISSNCLFIKLAYHLIEISPTCHLINLPLYQLAISSTWDFINLTFHQLDISSTWHFINLTLHQLDISSTWNFINLTFHQLDISSTYHFININLIFHKISFHPLLKKKLYFSSQKLTFTLLPFPLSKCFFFWIDEVASWLNDSAPNFQCHCLCTLLSRYSDHLYFKNYPNSFHFSSLS
jgi:hypothetical protein